ncbi:BTB/POZ domain-containing protein At5g66560-like [Typha angustifolia]|uniref:BTB/POZ domain-containing protein At5g66560-like n=1 Tax=Typha angustifolia TaxID=59011 RepID=UPI003C2DEEF1
MAAGKLPGSRGQAWFCTTGLPSDVVFEVDEMSFHLHKFPLMSKSRKIHLLITEQEQNRRERRQTGVDNASGEEEEIEEEREEKAKDAYHIALVDFPGGPGTFETAAKFCYGVKIELTAWNVAPLRCAAEYLEMTEEFAEDNLVSRTERYLAQSVLRNLKAASKTLKSCEDLIPVADELGIVQRCVDSIALRASSDASGLLSWPVNDGAAAAAVLWNGLDTGMRRLRSSSSSAGDSWFEDLAILNLPMYKKVIAAMSARDLSSEAIEVSLVSYAKRAIPGLSRSSRRHASAPLSSEAEQRELLETVITNLPKERSSRETKTATTTRFLFGLLRTANILRASEASRSALERKIASQLEEAAVDDLLIPNYSYVVETLYDVDCVARILKYTLARLVEEEAAITAAEGEEGEGDGEEGRAPTGVRSMTRMGKLIDGYLAEIASDENLKPEKFSELALALPDHARVYDDGLYRAVDIYLKAHPRMTEEEKEKVCGVVDFRKLTVDACTHAAQNERLPLRAVVQVLFFEQLQLRRVIAGTLLSADHRLQPRTGAGAGAGEEDTWRSAVRENQVLRLDMDSMRSRVQELERECSTMKRAIKKIDGGDASVVEESGGGGGSEGRSAAAARKPRKYGCRFSTQVCDSHERNVVQSRASRLQLSP